MFCPFCGKGLAHVMAFCNHCGKSIAFLPKDPTVNSEEFTEHSTVLASSTAKLSSLKQFMEFRKMKTVERSKFSFAKKNLKHDVKKQVQINVGVMIPNNCGGVKPARGKTMPVPIDPQSSAEQVLAVAERKIKDFNKDIHEGPYVLLYPDSTEVMIIPGTQKPFTVEEYKQAVGKPYKRITLFICLKQHFEGGNADSESDSEVIIAKKAVEEEFSMADTLPLDIQVRASTPVEATTSKEPPKKTCTTYDDIQLVISDSEDNATSALSCSAQHTCYREYTNLYAPVVIEDDSSSNDSTCENIGGAMAKGEDAVSASDIIQNLAQNIESTSCCRFNISRANVWDGALRGFRRSSYNPNNEMFVKFSDDAGSFEEAIDTGGPKREFLTILMGILKDRPIFDGPAENKYLTFNTTAAKDDEYYTAGKIIAVSVVHGGPGPRFLSRDFFNHISGQPGFHAVIEEVTDEDIKKLLYEIQNANSVDVLQSVIIENSAMLQTAGCFRHASNLEARKNIVKDYLQWYIIYRNHFAIQRFKDGLATLNFLTALEQHPTVLQDFMCYTEKKLMASNLEQIFRVELSTVGSNRRRDECRISGYLSDYLLDCEEQETAVSLEDVLMFATGLRSLPPAGIQPQPSMEFFSSSQFPTANTCGNILRLPYADNYDEFKSAMVFGIKNSPGFGCI